MTSFVVRSGNPLEGTVRIAGATKNAGLKQMCAALLAPGTTTLRNMTPVGDLPVMIDLFRRMGAEVRQPEPDVVEIDTQQGLTPEAPYELVSRMRASVNVLGALLGRCGEARVAMPGGDNIGSRKLDMHLRGLEAMGCRVGIVHGYIEASTPGLVGARHVLEFPSVGATENLMLAAARSRGTTVIENAAREPEIAELASTLNRMGGRVIGAGTSTIEIEGVDELESVDAVIMPDRIEAGTFLMACGMAGGEITLAGARMEDLEMVVLKLGEMGLKVSPTADGLWVRSDGRPRAVDVATLPYPGFATDFMPMTVALLAIADGTAIVTENLFDNRFGFVDELNRMGADVRTEGRHAVVRGVERLSGAPVVATDVRAGAALTLAGLAAEGETRVIKT
ncbi:MAG TPA: UDP-N-acetylglucosamine 1-carboxyvinyltransferase, partial [Acidimicrobiia bacterium]|nr:UDP-N-acetylglucosamine 1-carboxyvinyltransferase [Acidimicrobiia bacterium]